MDGSALNRKHLSLAAALIAIAIAVPGCSGKKSSPIVVAPEATTSAEATATPQSAGLDSLKIVLEPVAQGFEQPLLVTANPALEGALYVVEKTGRVKVIEKTLDATWKQRSVLFLDLSAKVSTNSERGLLGLAFPPVQNTPGGPAVDHFYVDYTDATGATVISRFKIAGDRAVAVPSSEEVLLRIDQPYANHNGGCILFGPDKMLWIGMGDGGSGGDPQGNGQNPDVLPGKILRIDTGDSGTPANGEPYGIPADNPFANPNVETAGQPEIWALGVRNPWRYSFDRTTGDLWIGDVGQDAWEEIDFVAGSPTAAPGGGLNFGWNVYEGTHTYPPGTPAPADAARYTMPVIEYDHKTGESVVGGFVYRGAAYTAMQGVYFYGDYVTGKVWGAERSSAGAIKTRKLLDSGLSVVSFGEDVAGELYLVDLNGAIYRIVAK